MSKDREKAALGAQTLLDFCNQFGDSVESRLLLDILFEGLMNEEALFVSGQQKQTRDQAGDRPPERGSGELQAEQSRRTEYPEDLATEDRPDYP